LFLQKEEFRPAPPLPLPPPPLEFPEPEPLDAPPEAEPPPEDEPDPDPDEPDEDEELELDEPPDGAPPVEALAELLVGGVLVPLVVLVFVVWVEAGVEEPPVGTVSPVDGLVPVPDEPPPPHAASRPAVRMAAATLASLRATCAR
jgi:hypothetical protein